jgi:hypothetical protein
VQGCRRGVQGDGDGVVCSGTDGSDGVNVGGVE